MRRITLRLAEGRDRRLIWRWRNDRRIRHFFFSPRPVKWVTHCEWFAKNSTNPEKRVYIAESEKKPIGVIRFEPHQKIVKVSVNVAPDLLGRGFGSRIVRRGTKKYVREFGDRKRVLAAIQRQNRMSRRVFIKAGYRFLKREGDVFFYTTGTYYKNAKKGRF